MTARTSPAHRAVFAAAQRLSGLSQPPVLEARTADGLHSIDVLVITAEGVQVAIEVDGDSHFRQPDLQPTGPTQWRNRSLAARGYVVVSVPYWEWNPLPASQHVACLEGKIEQALAGAAPIPDAVAPFVQASPSSHSHQHSSRPGASAVRDACFKTSSSSTTSSSISSSNKRMWQELQQRQQEGQRHQQQRGRRQQQQHQQQYQQERQEQQGQSATLPLQPTTVSASYAPPAPAAPATKRPRPVPAAPVSPLLQDLPALLGRLDQMSMSDLRQVAAAVSASGLVKVVTSGPGRTKAVVVGEIREVLESRGLMQGREGRNGGDHGALQE